MEEPKVTAEAQLAAEARIEGRKGSYRERSYSRDASRGRGVQSSKIVIEKLTKNVTESHLREIFGSYGRIESIDLPLNKQCKSTPSLQSRVAANDPSHDQSRHSVHTV